MNRKNRRRTGYRPGGNAPPDPAVGPVPLPARPAPTPSAAVSPPPTASEKPQGPRPPRKDQQRALAAYDWAEEAKKGAKLDEFTIAVQSFAATLLRSGFAAAVSVLERNKERGGFKLLLDHLASYPLPGIPLAQSAGWPAQVRALPEIALYMQATRELILLLGWLRRACRAVGGESAS